MFVELHSDEPNADFIVNGFHSHCAVRPYEWCYLIPPVKDRLGLMVAEAELTAAREYDEGMPYFDIDEVLSPEFQWARRAQLLASLPPDTPGNLWTYGMNDEE